MGSASTASPRLKVVPRSIRVMLSRSLVLRDMKDAFRIEFDSMGEMRVPSDAYYGAQTARAVENFPISGLRFARSLIRALGLIKKHAAIANHSLGLLDPKLAD